MQGAALRGEIVLVFDQHHRGVLGVDWHGELLSRCGDDAGPTLHRRLRLPGGSLELAVSRTCKRPTRAVSRAPWGVDPVPHGELPTVGQTGLEWDVCRSAPSADSASRPGSGARRDRVPPHSSGTTSRSVSENVHWWPGGVLGGVLALAVLEVGRLHQDRRAVGPCPLAVGGASSTRTITEWVDLAGRAAAAGRAGTSAMITAPSPTRELRAVVLADPHPLGEPERGTEPRDRRAHIRVDQHRDDRRRRDRAVAPHDS